MISRRLRQGFTLIEMSITIAVIVIVSVIIYANYNEINDTGEILAVSEQLREDVRLAQNFSVSAHLNRGKLTNGWGVYFNRNTNKYVVFSDLNSNKTYDFPTKILIHGSETITSGKFKDSSNNANEVQLGDGSNYMPTVTTAGDAPYGTNRFSFTGSQYLITNPTDLVLGTEDFTLDVIVSDTSYTTVPQTIIMAGHSDDTSDVNYEYRLYRDSATTLKFDIRNDSGTVYTLTSSSTITGNNKSRHVAIVRNGRYLMMFINGQTHDTIDIGANTSIWSQAERTYIGAQCSSYSSGCTSFTRYYNGYISEVRLTKGWANWFEAFTTPTSARDADEEKYREIKLPPGVVFERLYRDTTAINELNIYFSPINYWMYTSSTINTERAEIVINRAGMAGTGEPGDTPRTFYVWPSGLISLK